jgi:hypothetical protein
LKSIFSFVALMRMGIAAECPDLIEQCGIFHDILYSVHERGITGKGTHVCLLEDGCTLSHRVFKGVENQLHGIDVSLREEALPGYQDQSTLRYPKGTSILQDEFPLLMSTADARPCWAGDHTSQLIVSKPSKIVKEFKGGVAPDAEMTIIAGSHVRLSEFWQSPQTLNTSTALYTLEDVDSDDSLDGRFKDIADIESYKARKESVFSRLRSQSFYKHIIDDSAITQLETAFMTGAKVISIPRELTMLENSKDRYRIPLWILKIIENGLLMSDQVLVLSANNNSKNLSEFTEQPYFKQFTECPAIASRMLIVVNVGQITEAEYEIGPKCNYPGKDLKDFTVSAYGIGAQCMDEYYDCTTGLMSPALASARVAGYCLLVQQWFTQKYGKAPTASEIVEIVKNHAIPIGNPEIFGKGLVDFSFLLS